MQIVFVHIPKTGGTAVREALFAARPDAMALCDYGPENPLTSPLVRDLRYGAGAEGLDRLCERLRTIPAFILAGHVKAKHFYRRLGREICVTVLRDPVDRVVSHYLHARHRHGFGGSLVEFATLAQNRDVQARFVCGPTTTGWMMAARLERLAEDMRALSERLGVRVEPQPANVTPDRQRLRLSPEERDLVRDLNPLDVRLYQEPVTAP